MAGNQWRGGASGEVQALRGGYRGALLPDAANDGVPCTHGLWAANPAAGLVANNTVVSSFPNHGSSGSAWFSSGVARPTFFLAASQLNGKQALFFNRANNQVLAPSAFGAITQGANGYFVTVIAASTGPTATTEVIVGTGTASGAAGVGKRSANDWYNASDAAVLSSGLAYDASPKLIVAKFLGGSSRVKVNGVVGTVGNAGTSNLSYLKIGAGGIGAAVANPWTGYVHLVLVTNYDPETSASWPIILAAARDCGVTGI